MSLEPSCINKNILVVARWPLGGIRTYMRYTFRHLPKVYQVTLLASSTHEDDALKRDVTEYGAHLQIGQSQGLLGLVTEVFSELSKKKYDVILSQGFISGVAVYLANIFFRRPHILTIHGIVEPKFLEGRLKPVKLAFLKNVLSNVSMIYAVSNDILEHLFDQFPTLKTSVRRTIVIPNGIEMSEFGPSTIRSDAVCKQLGIPSGIFLFGFFGRFMQQKGFDLLIDAVEIMSRNIELPPFKVLAVGSGDYLPHYQRLIRERNLESFFVFLPFQSQIRNLYLEINSIVMPSRWEACPLQPMEALSMGIPLIASNCIGLRETVADTPAEVFASEDVNDLLQAMLRTLKNCRIDDFKEYMPVARQRFDVTTSTKKLIRVIEEIA